ncbi:DUF397 domain-containing protein [Streptomyces sp. NPDC101132]|uniref:DUF397 domain-containing protein n=1 Tax=Streptomyces sp. NPDC101132 TaxID=3366110 RepID=UPI003804BAEA
MASTEYDLSVAEWFKSSYSGGDGGDCIEVARWQKSTYSDGSGGNCIEIAPHCDLVPVRDSKNPDGPKLVFPAPAWTAFLAGVQRGDFPST